jgi:hypothetical protein
MNDANKMKKKKRCKSDVNLQIQKLNLHLICITVFAGYEIDFEFCLC